jgi:hypothetical protein
MILEAVRVNKCEINVLNYLNRFIWCNSHNSHMSPNFFLETNRRLSVGRPTILATNLLLQFLLLLPIFGVSYEKKCVENSSVSSALYIKHWIWIWKIPENTRKYHKIPQNTTKSHFPWEID